MTGGLLRCAASAVLALLFAVTGGAATAFAHTELTNSVPADGASLQRTPGSIQLSFSEPVDAELASVVVVGPKGENLAVGPPRQSGPGVMQPITAAREAGRIRVSYRVISLDGHPVSDTYSFTVLRGDPDAPLAPETQDTPGGAATDDTGLSAGLLAGALAVLAALVVGAAVARRRTRPAGPAPEPAVPGGSPSGSPGPSSSRGAPRTPRSTP
jgi:copper resistance protein C